MTADARRVPRLVLAHLAHSSNTRVRLGGYPSLDAADAEVTRAFGQATGVPYRGDTIDVLLVWDDRHHADEFLRVDSTQVAAAHASEQGLLRYLLLKSAKAAVAGSPGIDLAPYVVEQRRAHGHELLRRLLADDAHRRNAAQPRIARVHITTSDNEAVRPGLYRSLAHVDAMLDHAFTIEPAPEGRPFSLLTGAVIWTDGYELRPRVYVSAQLVRGAQADGGILRHALLRAARTQASPDTYRGWHPDVVARYAAEGRAVLARIEADTLDDEARRNASASTWRTPSLLPDPTAAIGRLRERFTSRRKILRAVGEWDDDAAGAFPATNHADVRYVMNHVSLALRSDVATLGPTAGAVVWNHWSSVRDSVETMLRAGTDADVYEDNEGLWTRQLPALVRLLDDARDPQGPLRNAA